MGSLPLAGLKVAVLVESQYIAAEIELYRRRFAEAGASVDLMANLYEQPSLTFVSEVEEPGQTPQTLTVSIDHRHVRLEDYAAVIQSANYTSVRLRHFSPPNGPDGKPLPITPQMVRTSPSVQFFGAAMRNPKIVKGALCHGLWILTPLPELLRGRQVICHDVVLADILNAGANFVAQPSGIVVDADLVTGRSVHETAAFIDAIRDTILARRETTLGGRA
jgi:putative intracellular protease/amidase